MKIKADQTDKTQEQSKQTRKPISLRTDETLDPVDMDSTELYIKARQAMDKILKQPTDYYLADIVNKGRQERRKDLEEQSFKTLAKEHPKAVSAIYAQYIPTLATPAFYNWTHQNVSYSPIKQSDSKRTKLGKKASQVGLRLTEGWDDPELYTEQELEKRITEVEKWNTSFKNK